MEKTEAHRWLVRTRRETFAVAGPKAGPQPSDDFPHMMVVGDSLLQKQEVVSITPIPPGPGDRDDRSGIDWLLFSDLQGMAAEVARCFSAKDRQQMVKHLEYLNHRLGKYVHLPDPQAVEDADDEDDLPF